MYVYVHAFFILLFFIFRYFLYFFKIVVTVIQPTFCIVIIMGANPSMKDHY